MVRDTLLFRKEANQFSSAVKSALRFLLDYPAFTNLGIM
jgi:hypothetical protein